MNTTIALHNTSLSFSKAFWSKALQYKYPVALWRLPHTSTIHLMVDFSGKAAATSIDLEELPAGFAFSPFLNEEGTGNLFIRADLHFTVTNGEIKEEATFGKPVSYPGRQEQFRREVSRASGQMAENIFSEVLFSENVQQAKEEKVHFKNSVVKAVEAISKGLFHKVVLSRTKEVILLSQPDTIEYFYHLCRHYPHAFVSLVFIPGTGVWIGASPETLISVDQNGCFRTISLAGTQPLIANKPLSQAVWTQKEIEEQALVSRYIVNCFKKIRLREYDEVGPRTVAAGNLMHLQTDFTVDTREVNFPQLGTVMLQLLHPTSAVCGMPREAALGFIREHEKHNRAFYSGFLGPVNIASQTHIFVNLRCMQLHPGKAVLYAGAGITADSDPQKEWEETELKCCTLLDTFRQK